MAKSVINFCLILAVAFAPALCCCTSRSTVTVKKTCCKCGAKPAEPKPAKPEPCGCKAKNLVLAAGDNKPHTAEASGWVPAIAIWTISWRHAESVTLRGVVRPPFFDQFALSLLAARTRLNC